MLIRESRRRLAVGLAIALTCASGAQAGILDSIKGLFGGAKEKASGLFGGGNSKQVTELLEQLSTSQKAVADKQSALSAIYNGNAAGIKPNDPALQAKLDDLKAASGTNEQLFMKLLQLRADAAKAGNEKALAPHSETIAKLTSTQNQLESNYQKIQETNRNSGFFTPTGEAAASSIASGGTGGIRYDIWNDPDAQQYMDEWLGKVHLNKWGQWTGTTKSATIKSAGAPESTMDKSRHEALWRMYANDSAHSNITLGQYVEARMKGDFPDVEYTPPAGGTPGGGTPGGGGVDTLASKTNTGTAVAAAETAASSIATPTNSDLTTLDAALRGNYEKLTTLTKNGQGSSEDAKTLLKSIEGLQGQRTDLIRKQQGTR